MDKRTVAKYAGIGAIAVGAAAAIGSHKVQAYGGAVNVPGLDAITNWLIGGGGLMVIAGYAKDIMAKFGWTGKTADMMFDAGQITAVLIAKSKATDAAVIKNLNSAGRAACDSLRDTEFPPEVPA